jgi:hypothetical protein
MSRVANLMSQIWSQRITDSDQAIIQNNSISTIHIYESNEQSVNDIYLNTIAKGLPEFDEIQQNTLEQLANQCPLTGGTAVFRARSILALVSDVIYDDEVLCQSGQQGAMKPTSNYTYSEFTLYPNPAQNSVTARLPRVLTQKGYLFLYNSIGEEVLQIIIPPETISIKINIENLPNGVYIGSVVENKKEIYTQRLVINH